MKIAQVHNNWGNFNPDQSVGIAAVLRDVTRGLMAKGHDVTVFASGKSVFPGVRLVPVGQSLRDMGLNLFHEDSPRVQAEYMSQVVPQLVGFDIIHSHAEHVLLPFIKNLQTPVVSTIHGAAFSPGEKELFETYPDNVFVALSEGAKRSLPYIHFSSVVYNGIDVEKAVFHPSPQSPGYFAWMGRFSENKGVLDAIAAAKEAGVVLTLVGFEEKGQESYFAKVKEASDGAQIRLVDRMVGEKKYSLLGNARAFLFPIHWDEPFGLIMVEAMATGTPVIAYNRGSVPEIVKDGVTGFVVDEKEGVSGLVKAMSRIDEIDRSACRRHVQEHFTLDQMITGYEEVYHKTIAST